MARAIAKIAKGLTYGIGMVDPGRARHFWAGNVIAAVTPDAAERYRSLCRWYGGSQLAERVRMIPHPVAKHFIASEEPKEERVICVGRWNDCVQKRPDRLAAVIPRILANRPNTKIDIVGSPGEFLRNWHQSLAKPMACRVILHGHIPSSKLARLMALARVGYCPSSFESFHIASGEALCAGASVVAGNSPSLPAFRWFAVNDSGALACSDTVESHADAVLAELAAWDRGERCAHTISAKWCPVLHAPEVAKRIIQLVDQHP